MNTASLLGNELQMSEEPTVEFEAKGFSLKLRGLKPIGQVAQYTADAVGIIGEPLGIVKDRLQAFRLNQAESAAIALKRAKEIKEKRGERIAPISQKYLANWIEGASNEDASSENILELWAKLLANAESNFDARLLAYNDALRKIGPKEAAILNSMVKTKYITGLTSLADGKVFRSCSVENCQKSCEEVLDTFFQIAEGAAQHFELSDTEDRTLQLRRCERILGRLIDGGIVGISVMSDERGGYGIGGSAADPASVVLTHAGLCTKHSRTQEISGDLRVTVEWIVLTEIGLGMFFEFNRRIVAESFTEILANESFFDATLNRIPKAVASIFDIETRQNLASSETKH